MRQRATRRLGMDMFLMLFLSMGAILYLILPLINIPEKKDAEQEAPPPQGNVIVEMYWPKDINADVDLWFAVDGDQPVGYSNKGTVTANLLRDDLGGAADASNTNMEIIYTRGLFNREHIVNAHLYSNSSGIFPIPVRIVVAMKASDDAPYTQLFAVTGELARFGQEKTFARFKIKNGQYVPDSFSTVFRALRNVGGER